MVVILSEFEKAHWALYSLFKEYNNKFKQQSLSEYVSDSVPQKENNLDFGVNEDKKKLPNNRIWDEIHETYCDSQHREC